MPERRANCHVLGPVPGVGVVTKRPQGWVQCEDHLLYYNFIYWTPRLHGALPKTHRLRAKHIESLSGFMDRGDCSRIADGDGAPIREKDLGAPSARGLTKRIGSLRHFLRLVNDSSGSASSIDKIADEAGEPFGLVGNTVRVYLYLREHIKQGNTVVNCYLPAGLAEDRVRLGSGNRLQFSTNATSHMRQSAGGWIGLWMP
jgi:hypothetical protein